VEYILDCMCYVKSVYRLLHSALKALVSKKVVTPCFPQIVNITELAKDYGKTYKYEYVM
jgi:hypothetical protein